MKRTPYEGLIAAAGFCAAAAVILVRRFYGLLESVDMVVPLSLWVMAVIAGWLALVVRKRRKEGRVGQDRSQLHPVQAAFWEKNGVQCGYCTSGMVMSVVALLNENPNPSDPEIREALEGNICRCTGYQGIVEAVQLAAERLASGAQPEPIKA